MAGIEKWYEKVGDCSDVVCSTRVRLARNLRSYPFPAHASGKQKEEIAAKIREALLSGNSILADTFSYLPLENLTEEEAVSLVEKTYCQSGIYIGPAGEKQFLFPRMRVFNHD